MREIVVLPGDGIGPVVVREAVRVLRATGVPLTFTTMPFGLGTGEPLPAATEVALWRAGVGLLGAATTPEVGIPSPVLTLRRRLGLDLLVRPARRGPLDVVVVGHATEGLYGEPEEEGPPAVARWVVTAEGADRLVAAAFARARRSVTLVDKPTVLRGAARLFRAAAARHARPGVDFALVNADAFVAALLRRPGDYDVIAGTSFVSDVLSDLTAALAGGVGAAPSASLGAGLAVFEPVHGSAPKYAADDPPRVNPVGAVLAAAMLLDHLGEPAAADRVRAAVSACDARTFDQGGGATTEEVGREIAGRVGG